jgi:hypothetical protein
MSEAATRAVPFEVDPAEIERDERPVRGAPRVTARSSE